MLSCLLGRGPGPPPAARTAAVRRRSTSLCVSIQTQTSMLRDAHYIPKPIQAPPNRARKTRVQRGAIFLQITARAGWWLSIVTRKRTTVQYQEAAKVNKQPGSPSSIAGPEIPLIADPAWSCRASRLRPVQLAWQSTDGRRVSGRSRYVINGNGREL